MNKYIKFIEEIFQETNVDECDCESCQYLKEKFEKIKKEVKK